MFEFTADFLVKKAWSKTIKNEVQRLFQGKADYPNFPEDEAELDQTLTILESWLPDGLGTKVKPYLIYLCKKLFQSAPEFTIRDGHDEDEVGPTLKKHREKYPTGPESDCGNFRKTINDLKTEVKEEDEAKGEEFSTDDMSVITAGADVIGSAGGWQIYKCDKKVKGDAAIKAMGRLCNNKKTGVTWCTGEDRGPVTAYINNGPFYVVTKDGRTRYALAHQQGPQIIDIIPPENVVVWSTGDHEASGKFANLEATAARINTPFDFSTISSIPTELIPVLTEAEKVDAHLKQMVPVPPPFDKETLKKVVHATPLDQLVADWNKNERDKGRTQAIMGVSIDLRQDLKAVYEAFTTDTLNSYITSLAAAGYTSLPKSLEDFIVDNF